MTISYAATRHGYANMWRTVDYAHPSMSQAHVVSLIDLVIDRGIRHKAAYQQVETATGVPWYWVMITHNRESGLDFTRHLHNGDPLSDYTHHEPPGRPHVGHGPPFTFAESATDALQMRGLQHVGDWAVSRCLYEWEAYNGFGYWGRLNSPYVWAWSNHYSGGKIMIDHGPVDRGVYDQQLGCAVLLKRMAERNLITLSTESETKPVTTTQLQLPKTLDLAAIEHTFEAINPFLPILSGFLPAATPIVLILETLLKAGAAIQQGQNILVVLPGALHTLATQMEAMAQKPAFVATPAGASQNATG